jgi:hypothetical protein
MRRFSRFIVLTTASMAVMLCPATPSTADGPAVEPPSGNPPPAGVIERIFDSVVEKLSGTWLEEAPAPINPVSEIEKLEKNIKRSPLPEYEQLVKDAEKTGADGVRPFYERLAELIERFKSLSADDDQPDPGPRPTLPPYCPRGCSNENGN